MEPIIGGNDAAAGRRDVDRRSAGRMGDLPVVRPLVDDEVLLERGDAARQGDGRGVVRDVAVAHPVARQRELIGGGVRRNGP